MSSERHSLIYSSNSYIIDHVRSYILHCWSIIHHKSRARMFVTETLLIATETKKQNRHEHRRAALRSFPASLQVMLITVGADFNCWYVFCLQISIRESIIFGRISGNFLQCEIQGIAKPVRKVLGASLLRSVWITDIYHVHRMDFEIMELSSSSVCRGWALVWLSNPVGHSCSWASH